MRSTARADCAAVFSIIEMPRFRVRLVIIIPTLTCGVGSFLAEVVDQLGESLETPNEQREAWLQTMLHRVVVGIDKSERMVRLALTNLAMFGFPTARLYLANSLSRNGTDGKLTESFKGKAKLILTNPPFGASFHGNDLVKYRIATHWSRRLPAQLDSELLFMERYLDWLAPGGHLVAIGRHACQPSRVSTRRRESAE